MKTTMTRLVLATVWTVTACAPALAADPRIGFRGDGTGSFPDAQPPVTWSATSNVLWKTPMPRRCNGSPIVVGDRVFTCSELSTLLCVSAADGKILWSDTVTYFDTVPEDDPEAAAIIAKVNAAKTEQEKEAVKAALKKDIMRCEYFEMPPVMGEHFGFTFEYTMPTPTSEGKQVYVVYGTGLVAAYDLEGKRAWVRMLAKPTSATGYSANPLLAGGRLVICMGGHLYGLDPATGKSAWEVDHKERHGSPVRAQVGGTELVVMPYGKVYRASDGKLMADEATCNGQLTAVVHGDVVYSAWDESFSSEGPPNFLTKKGDRRLMAARRTSPNALRMPSGNSNSAGRKRSKIRAGPESHPPIRGIVLQLRSTVGSPRTFCSTSKGATSPRPMEKTAVWRMSCTGTPVDLPMACR